VIESAPSDAKELSMSDLSEPFILVLTTAGSDDQAVQIGRGLVEQRLAACVNVVSLGCSIYRWQGKIEEEEEKLLIVKTSASLFERVREAIRQLHSYDVPEVLAIPIREGDPDYLQWLGESLGP
jgi:periplasmic divalent cation tolerance protein